MVKSIDEILSMSSLKLEIAGIKELQSAELASMGSQKIQDAKSRLKTLLDCPERTAVVALLTKLASDLAFEISELPTKTAPALKIVSGAPGSGKTHLSQGLLKEDEIYLCGDDIKKRFAKLAGDNVVLRDMPEYFQSPFIHALTSDISWLALEKALVGKKGILLEMLGTDSEADAGLIERAFADGFEIEVHHVVTPAATAVENAIRRYFAPQESGGGRHISLTSLVARHKIILEGFRSLSELVSPDSCEFFLHDNSNRQMELVSQWKAGSGKCPSLEGFGFKGDLKGLWFKGENLTSDMVVLAGGLEGKVLMIKRAKAPFEGCWALPGGFVNTEAKPGEVFIPGFEEPSQAAYRELLEETLIAPGAVTPESLVLIGTYADRLRDPRNSDTAWVKSSAFLARIDAEQSVVGSDDALEAEWLNFKEVAAGKYKLAFDHQKIIADAQGLINELSGACQAKRKVVP